MREFSGLRVETRCVFCNTPVGRAAACKEGRNCHFCRKPESHAADACIPGQEHFWVRGHEFQPVTVQ